MQTLEFIVFVVTFLLLFCITAVLSFVAFICDMQKPIVYRVISWTIWFFILALWGCFTYIGIASRV